MPGTIRLTGFILSAILCTTLALSQEKSAPASSVSSEQLQAMQADAKKMHVILDQMRTNLAFVSNAQSPLKHQFELEIDMWQMLLDHMDRRVETMQRRDGSAPPRP
jgi:hypothetical protein